MRWLRPRARDWCTCARGRSQRMHLQTTVFADGGQLVEVARGYRGPGFVEIRGLGRHPPIVVGRCQACVLHAFGRAGLLRGAGYDGNGNGQRPVIGVEQRMRGAVAAVGFDTVIHLAQSRHYRQFPERADDIFAVNVKSTFQLLDYARRAGAGRFLHASSGGVFGYSYEKFVETDPVNPLNFYLSSKYCAELMVGNYRDYFLTIVLRFFFAIPLAAAIGYGMGRAIAIFDWRTW